MIKNQKLRIEGASSNNKENLEVRSPYSGELLAKLIKPTEDEIDLAFSNAYNSVEFMRKTPAHERARILYYVANKIKENLEELSQLIALEGGKPLKDARIEVARAVNTVKFSADESLQLNGEQITMDRGKNTENHIAFTIKEPIGVVLAISAFNHPVNLICHQVATAIAAGNPVIVKPSEKTPLSAYKIVDYFLEAGLNPNAISVLPLNGLETEKIISDKRLSFVTFIGSSSVGWKIPKLVANGVAYALEHGGTATAIVDKSCDLELTATSVAKGAYYHAGQVCVSTQNVFIHEDVYEKFVSLLINKASNLITGDPNDEKTDVGPIITLQKLDQIMSEIEEAIQHGANLLLGGVKLENNCISPTILENTNYDMKVMKNEIFGPVVNVNKFNDINKVIHLANATPYSFQNAIYTSDINRALLFAREIKSKAVIINDSTAFRVDWMPFGGDNESGFGVSGVKYSINDLVKDKLIVIKHII